MWIACYHLPGGWLDARSKKVILGLGPALSHSVLFSGGSLTGPRTRVFCVDPSQCWDTESFSHLKDHTWPFSVGLGIWVLVLTYV